MAAKLKNEMQKGYGSDARPLLGEVWRRDSFGQTVAMTASSDVHIDNRQVDFRRYYDPAFAQAEVDTIWRKKWLYVGREEDLPEVGDRMPVQIGPSVYFIVHHAEGSFKAFRNTCPHRGTMLCAKQEKAETIRCPYHGWEWNNDGRLKGIPSHWDWPEITRLNGSLPEIKLERWEGFLFINADPEAAPLSESLGIMTEHLAPFDMSNRYTKQHFRKLVRANWKVTQEAFMESYHLLETHPEGVPFYGDTQAQYDIFPTPDGVIGRELIPAGVPSMHAAAEHTALSATTASAQLAVNWHYPDAIMPEFNAGANLRKQLGDWSRKIYEETYGRPSNQPDAIMLDSLLYWMYPHMCIWYTEMVPLVYQFLPHETDPNLCYFDVRLLMPWKEGDPRPPKAPRIEIGADESIYEKSDGFNYLAYIFDQDMANLPRIQAGIKGADPEVSHTNLGRYQESIIQFWNAQFDKDVKGV